ncbi:MAG: hypothetical protein AAF226_13755 [Verrucomicrobiota bacterium]
MKTHHSKTRGGFALLEIILAIGLFALVATSMVVALDSMGKASNMARQDARIFRRMESVMEQVSYRPRLGLQNFPADGSGVEVVADIKPADRANSAGVSLGALYQVDLKGYLAVAPETERTQSRIIYWAPEK